MTHDHDSRSSHTDASIAKNISFFRDNRDRYEGHIRELDTSVRILPSMGKCAAEGR